MNLAKTGSLVLLGKSTTRGENSEQVEEHAAPARLSLPTVYAPALPLVRV